MPLELGSYNFLESLTNTTVSSGGGIGRYPAPTPAYNPPPVQSKAGAGFDGVLYSFTNGISTIIDGLAQSAVGYTGGPGTAVATDRYGQPIYQTIDPRSGVRRTAPTSVWPGAPGGPGAYPERAPINYQTGGPWGWLTNLLSLPAPAPSFGLGQVPGTVLGPDGVPISTSRFPPWLVLGGIAILAVVTVRLVTR